MEISWSVRRQIMACQKGIHRYLWLVGMRSAARLVRRTRRDDLTDRRMKTNEIRCEWHLCIMTKKAPRYRKIKRSNLKNVVIKSEGLFRRGLQIPHSHRVATERLGLTFSRVMPRSTLGAEWQNLIPSTRHVQHLFSYVWMSSSSRKENVMGLTSSSLTGSQSLGDSLYVAGCEPGVCSLAFSVALETDISHT